MLLAAQATRILLSGERLHVVLYKQGLLGVSRFHSYREIAIYVSEYR